ncbi:MAG: MerR family transcriptional regulator [Woeseiaceae bacterium]
MPTYSISAVSRRTGLSADTLRYYERIGLLCRVLRSGAGRRRYRRDDIERLEFICRAKQMNFSLDEIATLIRLRADVGNARSEVRSLAAEKLAAINGRIAQLSVLRDELTLLLTLCTDAESGCPILESLSQPASEDGARSDGSLPR